MTEAAAAGNDLTPSVSGSDIRTAELPKGFRGYAVASTRALLNRAADRVDDLDAKNGELRARIAELEAEMARQQDLAQDTLSRTILAADRLAEQLVSDAQAEADAIRSEAESRQALESQMETAFSEELRERRSRMLDEIRTEGLVLSEQLERDIHQGLRTTLQILERAKSVSDRLASIGLGEAGSIDPPPDDESAFGLLNDIQPRPPGRNSPT